jgi:hypothetical protein
VADINIERRGPSIWPWIVGLLVLALLIWALVEMFGDRTEPVVTDPGTDTLFLDTPTIPVVPPPTVQPDTPMPADTPALVVPTDTV